MAENDYRGICLADPDDNWVYASPMSWNADSTKAMWMERQRDGNGVRVQIASLLDAEPVKAVEAIETPEVGDYADKDPRVEDVDGLLAGVSGSAHLVKKSGILGKKTVEVTYDHYSEDGKTFYDGKESSSGSILLGMRYSADLTVTDAEGNEIGSMNGILKFGAAYKISTPFTGSRSPQLDTKKSHVEAVWKGTEADTDQLVR